MLEKARLEDCVRCDPWRRTKVNRPMTCRDDEDGVETAGGCGLRDKGGANLFSAHSAPGIKAA